ncbi:MAG TPA: fluoride efflux transporter CrcB [Stellaceae bacterium]|jgi:CrcB protein|nr:fluoride efflux transporter CrcB [Stellaceae bacterium]
MISTYLCVALGGALGSMARFWLGALVAELLGPQFPWGTILINIIGSFVIGFFAVFSGPAGRIIASFNTRAFVMVGICGGFTTFSSFSLQTFDLAQEGKWLQAGGNVVLSVVACLIAVWAGCTLAAAFGSHALND